MEDILFQIQNHWKDRVEKKYCVVFIPKINYDCQTFIERNNLKAELNIQNLPIDMIPMDKDILTLEENKTISELFLGGDTNILSILTRAIIKFETVFGKIRFKYAKGDYAKQLKKILETEEEISPFETDSEIHSCIMMDRSVDYFTPLCSQYTYEGMIDEFIGINFNNITLKPEILEKKDAKRDIELELSSSDKFYSQIRDYNFNHLRSFLPNKLEEIQNILAEKNKQSTLKEISEYLDKFKVVKEESESVMTHVNIADYISNIIKTPLYGEYLRNEQSLLAGEVPNYLYDFYENETGKQSEMQKLLRLMCIESLVQNGLRAKNYDQLKRDFINVSLCMCLTIRHMDSKKSSFSRTSRSLKY
jgi:hypothetical protein